MPMPDQETTFERAVAGMLEIADPTTLVSVLRETADVYDESATELQETWQDPNAGKVWAVAARSLRQSAILIERYWESI